MDTAIARPELLLVADAVAREKSIDREEVLEAMEQAIQKAGRAKYGHEKDIRATIDRKTGDVRLSRWTEAVETVENEETQIPVHIARKFQPEIKLGEHLIDPLPPIDFGRIAAQTAKQVIVQRVREYERKRQYDEYKDRVGEIINGVVKRTEYGNLMVELGRAEALLRRDELIPRESFRNGDRVRAYIYDVREEPRGPQIFLSRTHPGFLAKLFAQEVPEIYDGIIEIKAVARDPGSRAKMAVISRDSSIDPVGACVGMRGSRVQAVVQELQGEKIDIIPWSPQAATFVVNALAPAEVTKVVMDEEAGRVEVVVPDEQLSLAIGRRGQNVRLASQLTRWDIDILTEAEESERRQEEFRRRSALFVDALDVDDVIAGLLVTEDFSTVEELAFTPEEELADIEGFDENIAAELIRRAEAFITRRDTELSEKRVELGVSDEIAAIEVLTPAMLVALGEKDVKTLDDLADLASDELIEIVGAASMDEATANDVIMAARAHWFADEGAPLKLPLPRRARRRITTEAAAQGNAGPADDEAADDEAETGPLRRCVVTRERQPKEQMIRFVVGPDRTVVPDLAATLPGRGIWLSARGDVLETARAQGGLGRVFARAARGPVMVPPDLPAVLEAALVRRIGELLGLARRAGQAVAGFDKAREWLRTGRGRLILQASDGSAAERARFLSGAGDSVTVLDPLPAAALGRVFGRDHVVHVAIAPGRLGERLALEATRLSGLRRTAADGGNRLNDDRRVSRAPSGGGHTMDGTSG